MVILFGIILIVTSLWQICAAIPAWPVYAKLHSALPEWMIHVRYVGSYLFRIIGLSCGIGLLFRVNWVRKFLVWFSWYCLITLPLRHTYSAMLPYAGHVYLYHPMSISLKAFTWLNVVIRWIIDGTFSIAVIYYFTRPNVVKQFKGEET